MADSVLPDAPPPLAAGAPGPPGRAEALTRDELAERPAWHYAERARESRESKVVQFLSKGISFSKVTPL